MAPLAVEERGRGCGAGAEGIRQGRQHRHRDERHIAQEDEHAIRILPEAGDARAQSGRHTLRVVGGENETKARAFCAPVSEVASRRFHLAIRTRDDSHGSRGRCEGGGQGPVDQKTATPGRGQLRAPKAGSGPRGKNDRLQRPRWTAPCRQLLIPPILLASMTPYDAPPTQAPRQTLIDGFGRAVTYLRVSVTDRCDLRCVYCMAEHMRFLPKAEVLTLEELDRIATAFVALGVRKIRLTGGEPLVRKGLMALIESLSRHLRTGALDELTLTTNGTRLASMAGRLAALGVRRINVSMDTLDPDLFARLTRGGDLAVVQSGIAAARAAGLQVKINAVALARDNAAEIPRLISWAHERGMDITLIETMPMGEIDEDRSDQFLPLDKVRAGLESFWSLRDLPVSTGGPARYVKVAETGGRLGFITPMTHNFCESCNRVRLTCTGTLHSCLGQEDATDLRSVIRAGVSDDELVAAIRLGVDGKPKGHAFQIDRGAAPSVSRHMSTTGG